MSVSLHCTSHPSGSRSCGMTGEASDKLSIAKRRCTPIDFTFLAVCCGSFCCGQLHNSPDHCRALIRPSFLPTPSAFADQKIFGSMPCPIVVSQVSWLLATPSLAHGLVSKDADNVIKVGTFPQSSLMVLPTPIQD